ncbi:MAG TPA: head GIN domain-containing protein [Fimbriimonadaceae bacterium]|nr:head GIN domain-containing protein [Fimbriimonadaceae bacterium]
MKKLIGLGLAAALLSGCEVIGGLSSGQQIVGSGKSTTISKHVASFKRVEITGSMDAEITIGKASDIRIEGDDNIVPHVTCVVKNDTLMIGMDNGSYSTHGRIKVSFAVPSLEGVGLTGSGDVDLRGYHGDGLSVDLSGSGNITADGLAKSLTGTISGSGNLSLFGLKSDDASVDISGSGNAEVSVSGTLSATIAGSGDIRYKGHPTVSKSVTGSGTVEAGD